MKLIIILTTSATLFLVGGSYLGEQTTNTIVTSFSYSAHAGIVPDSVPTPGVTALRLDR